MDYIAICPAKMLESHGGTMRWSWKIRESSWDDQLGGFTKIFFECATPTSFATMGIHHHLSPPLGELFSGNLFKSQQTKNPQVDSAYIFFSVPGRSFGTTWTTNYKVKIETWEVATRFWFLHGFQQIHTHHDPLRIPFLVPGWWLNQPIWKIWVKIGIFPNFRGENIKNMSIHHLGAFFRRWF